MFVATMPRVGGGCWNFSHSDLVIFGFWLAALPWEANFPEQRG